LATLDVNGRGVTYRIDGPSSGPLVILLNSLGWTMNMWDGQVPALSRHFRVLRSEYPGHGGAAAPDGPYTVASLGTDVVGLLDALDEPRASLVGLSLGGMVAMSVAAHAPDRVERLVLSCTAARLGPPEFWSDRAAAVRARGVGQLTDQLVGRWFTADTLQRRPELRARVAAMLAEVDPEGYAGCCEAISTMDQRTDLPRIAAPTLVLAGAEDPVTTASMALELQAAVAGSALVVLPGASHLANIERPAPFTAAVLAHLVDEPVEVGERIRREVLGDMHVDAAQAKTSDFTAPFQDLITRYAWGDIWSRPGLDRSTRSCITIAMLVALGRFDELPLHLRGALRLGLTPDQIREVLLQSAVYCGVPAANSAFAVAQRVLAEESPPDP
jgi:3-oxoadipate enol-lactonase / 4-carboxymuconolactone decarboxylase